MKGKEISSKDLINNKNNEHFLSFNDWNPKFLHVHIPTNSYN